MSVAKASVSSGCSGLIGRIREQRRFPMPNGIPSDIAHQPTGQIRQALHFRRSKHIECRTRHIDDVSGERNTDRNLSQPIGLALIRT